MPTSKKRKDKRGKPVTHTPRRPALTVASAMDLQAYATAIASLVQDAQAAFRALPHLSGDRINDPAWRAETAAAFRALASFRDVLPETVPTQARDVDAATRRWLGDLADIGEEIAVGLETRDEDRLLRAATRMSGLSAFETAAVQKVRVLETKVHAVAKRAR